VIGHPKPFRADEVIERPAFAQVIAAFAHDQYWHKAAVGIIGAMSAAGVVSRRRESVMLYER